VSSRHESIKIVILVLILGKGHSLGILLKYVQHSNVERSLNDVNVSTFTISSGKLLITQFDNS